MKLSNDILSMLPIKLGTELFFIHKYDEDLYRERIEVVGDTEWFYVIDSENELYIESNEYGFDGNYDHELGETVFLTKDEAVEKMLSSFGGEYD